MANKNSKRRQKLVNQEAKRTKQSASAVIAANKKTEVDSRSHRTGTTSVRIFGI